MDDREDPVHRKNDNLVVSARIVAMAAVQGQSNVKDAGKRDNREGLAIVVVCCVCCLFLFVVVLV